MAVLFMARLITANFVDLYFLGTAGERVVTHSGNLSSELLD